MHPFLHRFFMRLIFKGLFRKKEKEEEEEEGLFSEHKIIMK